MDAEKMQTRRNVERKMRKYSDDYLWSLEKTLKPVGETYVWGNQEFVDELNKNIAKGIPKLTYQEVRAFLIQQKMYRKFTENTKSLKHHIFIKQKKPKPRVLRTTRIHNEIRDDIRAEMPKQEEGIQIDNP